MKAGIADKVMGLMTKQVTVSKDEGIREGSTVEALANLKSAMPGGLISAGNASQFSDGAGACVVMSEALAEKRGLKLGCENREAVEEIPFESDFQFLFRELKSPALVYWHDTGHAQIKENLGFIHHPMHLESLADRLYGFHVHDVQFPGRDHRAPGTGTVDFAAIATSASV